MGTRPFQDSDEPPQTHVFPLIGTRAIVDLDTHDLMQALEAIKKRETIDVALRVQNYLQSIMREAKRKRLIAINPAYDLEGLIKAPRAVHRPAPSHLVQGFAALPLVTLGVTNTEVTSNSDADDGAATTEWTAPD